MKTILTLALLVTTSPAAAQVSTTTVSSDNETSRPPNIVFIFADDLGYGDLSCYGNTEFKTPHLDQMASEGVRLTEFYVASPACSPSRAALLTGQYPLRTGVPYVLNPKSMKGIHDKTVLIPEVLKERGYATAIIGKWHLGHLPQFMPWNHGFDYYFGLPYSNDMKPAPLFRNKKIIEANAKQDTLTQRYTEEVTGFIDKAAAEHQPFFIYYANNFPHIPLHVNDKFKGASESGLYGDVITELDWSVGQVLKHLREKDLAENTLVIFTSDNGPWMIKGDQGGSAGKLRGEKGQDYEGGVRVPFIAWWPSHLPGGEVIDIPAMTIDMMPTLAHLTGAKLPEDVKLDGKDIWPVLKEGKSVGERTFVYPDYYPKIQVGAIRKGEWKLLLGRMKSGKHDARTSELINIKSDPYEQHNALQEHPEIAEKLQAEALAMREELNASNPWGENAREKSKDAMKYVTEPGLYD